MREISVVDGNNCTRGVSPEFIRKHSAKTYIGRPCKIMEFDPNSVKFKRCTLIIIAQRCNDLMRFLNVNKG